MDSNELLSELAIMLAERHAVERVLRAENQELKATLAGLQQKAEQAEAAAS